MPGAEIGRTIHLCVSVRGVLAYPKRQLRQATKWLLKGDGSRYTPEELREALYDALAAGNEVIPAGDCDNFDPKKGCRGHERSNAPREAVGG